MLVYDLLDYEKKLPFEVLQNAVRQKSAKLKGLTFLKAYLLLSFINNNNNNNMLAYKAPVCQKTSEAPRRQHTETYTRH